jgi:hypothetical protein
MNTVERGILMPLGPALVVVLLVVCLLSFASPERRPGATPPSLGFYFLLVQYCEATSTSHTGNKMTAASRN